jgi:hypothetical protein
LEGKSGAVVCLSRREKTKCLEREK